MMTALLKTKKKRVIYSFAPNCFLLPPCNTRSTEKPSYSGAIRSKGGGGVRWSEGGEILTSNPLLSDSGWREWWLIFGGGEGAGGVLQRACYEGRVAQGVLRRAW